MKYYWNYIDTFVLIVRIKILNLEFWAFLSILDWTKLFSGLILGLITRNQTQMFSIWQYTIFIELEREKWIYLINIGIKMNIIIKLK